MPGTQADRQVANVIPPVDHRMGGTVADTSLRKRTIVSKLH